jgi:hypothetical protein
MRLNNLVNVKGLANFDMHRACCDLLNHFFQRRSMAAEWQTSQEVSSAAFADIVDRLPS